MPFGLTNAPVSFQREINRILRPLLGMELVIDTKVVLDDDGGMVVVAHIDNILIATKGSLEKHHHKVSKVFQSLMDNHMCVEIDKCISDAKEVPFLGFLIGGTGLKLDPEKAKAIVNWPRPTNVKEVQQLLALWNFYRRFVPGFATIVASIRDLLKGKPKHISSAKTISVRVKWLRQSARAPSEASETPRLRITPHPASIPRVAPHIALRSPFHRFFSLCQSPILNKHSGVVANFNHTSEWVHWVHACIGIAMQRMMVRKSLLAFLLH